MTKQLTRRQLQNDLDAARKREAVLREENGRYHRDAQTATVVIRQLTEDVADWKGAFKMIMKLVK